MKKAILIAILGTIWIISGCYSNRICNQYSSETKNRIRPTVKSDGDCNLDYLALKTNQALDLLENEAPDYYNLVVSSIGVIECTEGARYGSGIYVWKNPPIFKVRKQSHALNRDVIWYAGILVHEAYHVQLYRNYLSTHPLARLILWTGFFSVVPEEIYGGENGEAQCLEIEHEVLRKLGASQEQLNDIKNAYSTRYWEIKPEDRWW